jgi:hypothetical protein
MEDYKEDIRNSRRGSLGSSDGKLILQVCERGEVPKSAYKRLAVLKGFIEQQEIPQTAAVRAGDELEMLVYDHLKSTDDRYQSNPLWVSTKFSRKNVKLISHPDIVLQDDEKKVLNVYEVKCTKFTFEQTKDTYKAQLIIHWVIANEVAKELGGYKVRLSLVHYSTEGMNLEDGFEFDPSRLTVKTLRNMEKLSKSYHLAEAMDLIDAFLEDFNEFYEDEVDGNLLPEKVKTEFDQVTTFLTEIKEREKKVEDFKKKLTEFMISKGVKAIKTDAWAITLVNESESVSVDYKAIFANEIEAKKPRIANKLKKQYKKVTKKKAYIKISIRENETENGL